LWPVFTVQKKSVLKNWTHEKPSPGRSYSDTTIPVVCAHMEWFSSVKERKCSLKLKDTVHGDRARYKWFL
jgi:hypothetical protein